MSYKSNILVVDDEQTVRHLVGQALTDHGHRVKTAAGGEEAVGFCIRERFDLILVDLIMPGMDGIETILALRAKYPAARIIAIAGDASQGEPDYLPLALKLGVSGALAKPLDRAALLQAVDSETNHRGPLIA